MSEEEVAWLCQKLRDQRGHKEMPPPIERVFEFLTFVLEVQIHYQIRLSFPACYDLREGGVLLIWEKDEHHLDVEIPEREPNEVFYKNRKTNTIWDEDIKDEVPREDLIPTLLLFKIP